MTKDANRGVNIAVLNQASGAVMAARSFDTYSDKKESKQMVDFVAGLLDKRIICFAVKV